MTINPDLLKIQPGDDQAKLSNVPGKTLLSFDLATPDNAPDEWKQAAARRVSSVIGVPDPDGRMWKGQPFQTGTQYLDFLRGMVKNGNIWDYSATQDLKDFSAADEAGRIAIARKAMGFVEKAADGISKAVIPNAYGVKDDDALLAGAPSDVIEANRRLRNDTEASSRKARASAASVIAFDRSLAEGFQHTPRPEEESKADREAVDTWRAKKEDASLATAHHEKLMRDNVWALWLTLSPSLSDKGREIATGVFENRKLKSRDIADFQRLDEKEQAVITKLARMARNPVEGTFWNTMGDSGIGFLNGVLMTPVNAIKQVPRIGDGIDRMIFGKNSPLLADASEMNRKAREEQRLMEALDDQSGINPSGAEHGYLARSIIGAVSTLPYMGYASIPYVGAATVGLDFMQQLDDRIASEGGDIYGKDPEWLAQKAVYGALYAGIEKLSAIPIFKETGDIGLKIMFAKLATSHGAAAAEKLVAHIGKDTFVESLEEATQKVIEDNAVSVGLDRGPEWREAIQGGVREFAESLGTMGIISTIGAGRQAYSARSKTGRDALYNTALASLQRESFLASNPYTGEANSSEAKLAIASTINDYRTSWEKGGQQELVKQHQLTEDQASILNHIFGGEKEFEEVGKFIDGRNIYMRSASLGIAHEDATPESIRALVAETGPEAQARLVAKGFTEEGASRVAQYFNSEAETQSKQETIVKAVRNRLGEEWAKDDPVSKAVSTAETLQPLRSLFQRSGTVKAATKAFTEIGFDEKQSASLASAFEQERKLATSPEAAAAFRAFYLDTSEEESATQRLKRMTGFEAQPAPEQGEGAARLTLKDASGTIKGSVLFIPDFSEAFNPESANAGEAIEQATQGIITQDDWKQLTPEQRKDTANRFGVSVQGGFTVTSETDPEIPATGAQADVLTGKLTLTPDAPSATLYHEATHAWLAVMRHAGKLTETDVQKLQARYGVAQNDSSWFNEEKLSDDIKEIGAQRDFRPDQSIAARFVDAIRRLSGAARLEQMHRKASSNALQSLYENIVYGSAFEGIGDIDTSKATAQAKSGTSPVSGATTATPEERTSAEATPTEKTPKQEPRKAVKKEDPTAWTAATPQGNLRVGGYWVIAPRDRFISDTDPRYDFSLQDRARNVTTASTEQVEDIATQGKFDPLRLMESPDTKDGSPIAIPVTLKNAQGKDEEFYMVLAGNGRFRALDKIDADNRGDEYRNPIKLFADEKGIPYKPEEMTADAKPRLVRVMTKKPVNVTHQEIALLSNQESILQKTDAEKASTDAELIERDGAASLFSANKDGLPSKSGSDEFFAWFVRATGDKSLKDSQGNPTAAARERARRAMLAVAIGKGRGGKETVMVFTETADALGLERQRDALLMAAGTLSALEGNKPDYGLSNDLSRAAASILAIARDRKVGKTIDAETFIKQGDLLDPIPQAVAELIRILDANRPAEGISETFRRYAELASRIDTDTPDMFGEPPAPKHELLKKAQADTEIETGGRYSITSDKLVDRVRYSIALAARRYALATDMPKEGEQGIKSQLEFLFARQLDPDYADKMELANRKRQATKKANLKAKEDARLNEIREATAWALADPYNPDAWERAFEKSGNTVSRVIHDYFNPQENHFPHSVNGVPLVGLKVETTQDLAGLFMPLRNPHQESMKVAFFDDKNRILGAQVITLGLLDQTPIHPREMFKKGLALGATGYIFSHNHPSGDPSPSKEDLEATRRISEAGAIIGLKYIDHIITNGNTFYSLKENTLHRFDKAITPAWEAIPSDQAKRLHGSLDAMSLVNTLKQGNGNYIHAILVDTKNKIVGVHRIPITESYKPEIVRSVFRAAADNPTAGIILDLSADALTVKDFEDIKRLFTDTSRVIGIPVVDFIFKDAFTGSFKSDKTGAFLSPAPKANTSVAEGGQPWTRYSVTADAFSWIRDFNDESFGDEEAGPERDTRERLAAEYAEIEAQHTHPNGTRKDSWMKAPNGNRTNLEERQWVLVRTPSFKAWFGDWENDKGNSSKVVDENGEPLVVYHGTQEAGFSEFMMSTDWEAGGDGLPLGHYFSSRVNTAYTYSGSFDFAREFVELDERGKPIDIYPAIYPTFLNIRNLQTYDYDGADWNRYTDERTGKETTRTLAKRSLKAGADGVLFKNVIDNGGEGPVDDFIFESDDVYVVFSNNNIKSATDNTGAFSSLTDDIRYSVTANRYADAYRVILENDADYYLNPLSFGLTQEEAAEIESQVEGEGAEFTDDEPDHEGYDIEGDGRDMAETPSLQELLSHGYQKLLNFDAGKIANPITTRADIVTEMEYNIREFGLENPTKVLGEISEEQTIEIAKDAWNYRQALNRRRKAKDKTALRYSIQTRDLQPVMLPDNLAEVFTSTSVAALSQTKFKTERAQHKSFRDVADWEGAEAYAKTLTQKNDTILLGQYLLAKYHGDIDAAVSVVEKWAKPSEALRLKSILGDTGLLKPVVTAAIGQKEGNRFNALPMAYAEWLARKMGGYASLPITKIKGDPNTGAAMADRTSRDYEFTGGDDVDSASPVILVDDVWTSGQTLWTAYEHLKAKNLDAHVLAFATIASGRYGKSIRPTQKQLTAFWEKSKLTTTSFKERIGNEITNLIGSEIQAYILTGKAGPDGATEFFGGSTRGSRRDDGRNLQENRHSDVSQVRYSIDITGAAYNNDPTNLVKGWMAAQLVAGNAFPSKVTVQRLAQQLGIESFDYQKLADEARWLEQNAVDNAIRKAATSGDSQKAIYAVGELARKAAYVRSGMQEGVKLARNTDRIRTLSDEKARKAIQLITGADYADIEVDTGIDIAATILASDPKKFHPEDEKKQTSSLTASSTEEDSTDSAQEATTETDEEAPGLTDKQRAEIVRKRREREERIQAILDQATKRGEHNRKRDEERKLRAAANEKAESEEQAAAGSSTDGASGVKPAAVIEDTTPAAPINFADRFEAAAFLRLWAFDRFRRENPNSLTNPNKDRVAIEFYRKTATKELSELARKLLEPGYKREIVLGNIADIVTGLTANQVERRTAYVFGLLNRYAVREERKTLVKSFRAEVKRQFVKGEHFEELGIDLGRTLTGAIEEDARYVMKVCEMSERQLEGETSTLQRERDRLNAIIDERTGLTDMDGNPVSEESGDMSLRKALRQLALLDQYGGMVDMMPGEIMDLSGKALDAFAQEAIALHQRWEEYDKIVKAIKEPLSLAISRKPDDPVAESSFLGSLADSLTGMLRMRLDFLTRYADPAKREAGRAAIADIMDLLARGNTEYVVSLQEDEASLVKALGEILQKPNGSPDRRRIRAYLKRMDEKIPHELSAALSKQGLVGRMTYGQMLQLLVSLDQTASYGDNIKLHDRQGQADLIRSFAYADPKTGETRRALSNEDAQLVEWLRRSFYPSKRETISEVTTRLAGRPIDNPDPFYAPIKLLLQKKTALHVGSSAWQPLAGVFSRRVKNKLDFDEKASILDIFKDRSHETALLIAFSERGLLLREILTSGSFQGAVTRFHGQAALTGVLKQVEQTLNGGKPRTQSDAQTAAASMAMKVATYTGLGWNMQSAMKQTASLPVFANKIGFNKLFSILAKPIDKEAIRILKESDEYRVRYGTGSSSGMDIATKGAYENPKDSVFKKFFGDWGLWANRKTDWIMSAWVGQGVFRDLKSSYMDKGMSEADAERRAISETFSLIEETQQSGRTENTLALTREHGILGKMLTQFATSPLQQMQYEIKAFREWRDLTANQGPEENIKEARDHFMRAFFINHVIVPTLMTGITSLYKAATGDEPDWKKEGFWWTLLIASIMGQFSRVLFLGAFTEQTLRAFFLRERPNLGQLVPAEGVIRFSATMAYPVRDIVTWDMEHLLADVKRMLKSTAVTRLPTKLYEAATDQE